MQKKKAKEHDFNAKWLGLHSNAHNVGFHQGNIFSDVKHYIPHGLDHLFNFE